jgi:tripartite-type tricarboxylate transporter receptor subunit TctC
LTSLVSDPQTKQMLRLLELPDELGRPYVMPPGSPVDKVTAMRAAFDATMRDEAFLADAGKAMLEVDPMSGDDMARRINEAYATPKEIVTRALPYSGSPE